MDEAPDIEVEIVSRRTSANRPTAAEEPNMVTGLALRKGMGGWLGTLK